MRDNADRVKVRKYTNNATPRYVYSESLLPLSAHSLGLETRLGNPYPEDILSDSDLLLEYDMLNRTSLIDLLPTAGLVNGVEGLNKDLNKWQLDNARSASHHPKRSNTMDSTKSDISTRPNAPSDDASQSSNSSKEVFQARPGYTAWVSQAVSSVSIYPL